MMRFVLAGLAGLLSALAPAAAQPAVIETAATHVAILDHASGEVLFSKNGAEPMIPASMTKIMTVQVVFDRLRTGEIELTDRFTVSERAWNEGGWASGGSTMGLAIGDQPTVEELLRGAIVLSGNDACIVLAEGLSGSEEVFASEMTALADEMGLDSANFTNATGLDEPDHRISAIDLARLSSLQIMEYPEFYKLYAQREYEWRGISQPNRNPLLGRISGADGLKTGHLSVSGYGLAASAVRDGQRRVVVLNGMESAAARAQEAERLMRLAFSAFTTETIEPGDGLGEVEVWLGARTKARVALDQPVSVTAHRRAFEDAKMEIVYQGPVEAPIAEGQHIADLVISIDGRDPVVAPLVAMDAVPGLGFLGRIAEGVRRTVSGAEN